MKFNLNRLKKVHQDEHSTVLRHQDGHEIKINHKLLSPKMRGELEAISHESQMQNFPEGGEVQQSPELEDIYKEEENAAQPDQESVDQQADPQQMAQQPFTLPPATDNSTTTQQDPYGSQATLQGVSRAYGLERQGIQQEAQAAGQQSKEEVKALQEQQAQLKSLMDLHQIHNQNLLQEINKLNQDVTDGYINPQQFFQNKSIPGKISTVIGLILGGLGGSDTPIKMLQYHIDNDMKAQQLNLSNKQSLLNSLRGQYHDEQISNSMARLILNDQASTALKLAGARASDPMARARAMQAAGILDNKKAQEINGLGLRMSMLQQLNNPNLDPATKLQYMAYTGMIQPQQHEQAAKELADYQNVKKAKGDILNYFDTASKENTIARTGAGLFREPASVGLLENSLLPLIKDKEGRVNEFDFNTTRKFIPKPGDTDKKIKEKKAGLIDWLQQKGSHPNLQGLGIIKDTPSRFTPEGQNRFAEKRPKVP